MENEQAALPSARSDLISGGVWVVIGVAIAIGSWRMDRLENQGVPGFAAPGLVPGVMGVLITLAALLIVFRSLRRGALQGAGGGTGMPALWGRLALTLALCLGFAIMLVGHGLPFWVAASTYLFLHIFLLQLPERRAAGQVKRGLAVAVFIGVTVGVVISLMFQYLFLVRLP
jgi:hypothetical protein